MLHAFAYRLKTHRNDRRGEYRQCEIGSSSTTHQRTDADSDGNVHSGDEPRERPVHQRAADDHVEVVEAVFQQGDADRDGDSHQVHEVVDREADVDDVAPGGLDEKVDEERRSHRACEVREPTQLLASLAAAAPQTDHGDQHCGDQGEPGDSPAHGSRECWPGRR